MIVVTAPTGNYPFSMNAQGRALLNAMDLPSVEQAKIAHGNADALLGLAD